MSRLLLTIILILLIAGFINSRRLMRINIAVYGFLFGSIYFLFFPLLYTLWAGRLNVERVPALRILLQDILIVEQSKNMVILLCYVIGIYIIFWLSKIYKTNRASAFQELNSANLNREFKIFWGSILLYFLISVYILISSNVLAGGHWYRTRGEFLAEGGTLANILLFTIWGLRILIVAYNFELLTRKRINILVALAVFILVSSYELLYVGNRIIVLMFGVAGFVYIYNRYGLRLLLPGIIALIPLATLMSIYQNVRYLLFNAPISKIFQAMIQIISNGKYTLLLALRVFEYADAIVMLNIFSYMGTYIQPLNGLTLAKIFTWFIPRSIWATKPPSITVIAGETFMPGSGVSLATLAFGEFHYNFGLIAPLIFPFLMFILLYIVTRLSKQFQFDYYIGLLIGFLLFRLPLSDVMISFIFAIIIYKMLSVIFYYSKEEKEYRPKWFDKKYLFHG